MPHQTTPSRAQRLGVLTSVAIAHGLLLILVLASRGAVALPPTKVGALMLVSLNAEAPAQSRPPPPALPSKIADRKPLAEAALSSDPDSITLAAASGGCAPLEMVTKALVADPAAMKSVINAPPETRSIAEAVVLWNAGWSDAAVSSDAPLGPARLVVERSLEAVEDACLDAPIAGPRLVPIPDGERTMFLVFGSGAWTWRELTASADPQQVVPPETRSIFDWDWL